MSVRLHKLGRGLSSVVDIVSSAFNIAGTLLILALVMLINADVGLRSLFGNPISGVPEIVSLSIVAIVFLQIAQTVRLGRLTRADSLINLLERHSPRLRSTLEALYNVIAAIVLLILFHASLPQFLKAWNKNTYIGSIGDFTAPVWPVKLIILVGCVTVVLQFLLAAARCFANIFGKVES